MTIAMIDSIARPNPFPSTSKVRLPADEGAHSGAKTEWWYLNGHLRDDQGRETIFEGGSRAWRNHNPGNIVGGTFADALTANSGDSTAVANFGTATLPNGMGARIVDAQARVVITANEALRGSKAVPLKSVLDEAMAGLTAVRPKESTIWRAVQVSVRYRVSTARRREEASQDSPAGQEAVARHQRFKARTPSFRVAFYGGGRSRNAFEGRMHVGLCRLPIARPPNEVRQ